MIEGISVAKCGGCRNYYNRNPLQEKRNWWCSLVKNENLKEIAQRVCEYTPFHKSCGNTEEECLSHCPEGDKPLAKRSCTEVEPPVNTGHPKEPEVVEKKSTMDAGYKLIAIYSKGRIRCIQVDRMAGEADYTVTRIEDDCTLGVHHIEEETLTIFHNVLVKTGWKPEFVALGVGLPVEEGVVIGE